MKMITARMTGILQVTGMLQRARRLLYRFKEKPCKDMPATLLFTQSETETFQEIPETVAVAKTGGQQNMTQESPPVLPVKYQPYRPGEKIRILFLFQTAVNWPSWETVYKALSANPEVECLVLLTPRLYLDTKLKFLNEGREFLIQNDIPFMPSSQFSLDDYKPHVVFMQTPYYDTLPQEFWFDNLERLGCRIAYIPYGIEIGGGVMNSNYQFNLDMQNRAWRIFARSKRHQKMYARYCKAGSHHVVPLGHPRADYYPDLDHVEVPDDMRRKIGGRKTVLWNPHFSVEKGGWSTFLKFYDALLNYFAGRKDVFLIARPHPLLPASLRRYDIWGQADYEAFAQRVRGMDNAYFDTHESYLPAFRLSDFILSDVSSFFLEYALTGKPVVYLKNAGSPGLNDDGDFLDYLYQVETETELARVLGKLLVGDDEKRVERLKALDEYLLKQPQGNGQAIADYLVDAVKTSHAAPHRVTRSPDNQARSLQYWQKAVTTYLAAPDYYDRQERALADMLAGLPLAEAALDIGCGDGRFTKLVCGKARQVTAIDVSPHLIEAASANLANYDNVKFLTEIFSESLFCQTYDLVLCMGVTSTLVDDFAFLQMLDKIRLTCREGGYLIMNEFLSLKAEQYVDAGGYLAAYRKEDDYLNAIRARGFTLAKIVELSRNDEKNMINSLYLFAKGK